MPVIGEREASSKFTRLELSASGQWSVHILPSLGIPKILEILLSGPCSQASDHPAIPFGPPRLYFLLSVYSSQFLPAFDYPLTRAS